MFFIKRSVKERFKSFQHFLYIILKKNIKIYFSYNFENKKEHYINVNIIE